MLLDATLQGTTHLYVYSKGTYKQITVPGYPNAFANGSNPSGNAIVGTTGAAGSFVFKSGLVTTLKFPGAMATIAYGVNDVGTVVGTYEQVGGYHGFIWTPPADASEK